MESTRKNLVSYIIGFIIVITMLFFIERFNYLLFHSLAELFSITIACTLFLIMWNSKKYMENKTLVFISIGYIFIAIIDLLHTLSYQGMAIFVDYDFHANQLWVAARYMEGLTLLIAFAWPNRVNQMIYKVGAGGILAIYGVITGILVTSVFVWHIFPICFIADQGQTEFKIISEYIICLILIAGILLLWKNREDFNEKTYTLLIAAMTFTILQELSFALYTDNYGVLNMIGHYFKIISFYLMYRAIVKTGIEEPYELIFRELTLNESKLKQAKNEAEVANKMKSSFLANMSHEIRTPLNSILGFANLLFEEERDPEKFEKLEIITNSGSHLLSLVNNILEFSKIEVGKIELDQSSFSIHKLLKNLRGMFILKSQERHLSWEVSIDSSVPEIIVGDEHRIMQVLVNLTGNAFKFTEFGGVSILVSYLNAELKIRVKDTGIGIPESKKETIFSAFEQVDAAHARKDSGAGLGLSITKSLLELMGGTIRVKSSDLGSEFIVSLPAQIGEMCPQEQLEPILVTPEVKRSERGMFLVVDRNELMDKKTIKTIIQEIGSFEGASIKVLPLDTKTKDRILMAGADLVLLYENGSSKMKFLARELRQDFRTEFIPVIFLKECSGDQVNFQADSNALKYGKASPEDGLYKFIRQIIQARETFGRELMKQWLERAEAELGAQQILLECLNNIVIRVEALENALVDEEMDHILSLTHSLKGGTGTLRMNEVSLLITDMEAELRKKPTDPEKVKKLFSTVKEIFALIPQTYFNMERLQFERRAQTASKLNILLVDDNLENQKLIGTILKRLSLTYKQAENGKIALEMLQAENFNLVLLDSQMPVMDGITTLQRIRENPALKGLYVIMQTASTFKEDIQEFFRAGCDDYISKPVDSKVLQRKLMDIISQ